LIDSYDNDISYRCEVIGIQVVTSPDNGWSCVVFVAHVCKFVPLNHKQGVYNILGRQLQLL